MKIVPFNQPGACCTGNIDSGYTVADINRILGFKPNVKDDPYKVRHSWGFKADGKECGIWDYKGSRWSTYGPKAVFNQLFPGKG
jgi:hypothetical protein